MDIQKSQLKRFSTDHWQTVRLGDVAEINMGQSPRSEFYNTKGEGMPFMQGVRTFGALYPVIDTWCTKPIKTADKGDVLFSVRAPVGDINYAPELMCIGRGLASMKSRNNKFLFYLLEANKERLIGSQTGSVFGSVSATILKNFKLLIPTNTEDQDKIAEMLGVFDDKIELLRRENETLESIAQTLFKEWFVEFNFPDKNGNPYKKSGGKMIDSELGLIPEGWRVRRLEDFGEIVCGKTPSKSNPNYFGGNVPFIKIPDMHQSVFITSAEDSLTEEGEKTQRNKTIPKDSVVVSCIATVGLVGITTENSQTNQQINAIVLQDVRCREFVYLHMISLYKHLQLIASGGSATLNINTNTFSKIEIISPEINILFSFHNYIFGIFEKIKSNLLQIQTLSKTRDRLLDEVFEV